MSNIGQIGQRAAGHDPHPNKQKMLLTPTYHDVFHKCAVPRGA